VPASPAVDATFRRAELDLSTPLADRDRFAYIASIFISVTA